MKFKLMGMKNQLEEQEKRVNESQQRLRKVEADQQTAKTTLDEVFVGELKLVFESLSENEVDLSSICVLFRMAQSKR